ncbi:uncharacterized protein LOC135840048 isoform X1 [Planococcus citri]|uniref:uncharacterized protein LOC135840048 isoform X1 n=1 Tax=Planococcus citri TaxID=170843 RepID=UPI0031F91C7A
MKLILLAAVFSTALIFVAAAPSPVEDAFQQEVKKREEEALRQCNITYPVAEDSRLKFQKSVFRGESIIKEYTTLETCNLYCNLQKLGFFDGEGNMQVRKVYKFILKLIPKLEPNSNTLLFHLFSINRSTRGLPDKCSMAYAVYYRFTEAILVASISADLNTQPEIRDKLVESLLTGEALPKDLQTYLEKYMENVDLFVKQTAAQNSVSASTPVPAQVPST